ncbi:hypothetical protein [Alkalimarinus alittae]|uniref:Uncharacterized protein n=1 Tax=Alkalimarinus alittae TaxID=2961619 RepID=A0ABY6MZG8_9ALTE|nr:hypothetical protein [Alkalimarinus alittae]UZE95149.1 hypothetical protein NKI27_13875 [Alkalimarinus alittae]
MDRQINNQAESIQENQAREQAFIDYLIWSVAHDQDPHNLYDDPIAVFRSETQQEVA